MNTEPISHPFTPMLDATARLLAELNKIALDPETPPHVAHKILTAADKCGLDEAIKNANKPFNN